MTAMTTSNSMSEKPIARVAADLFPERSPWVECDMVLVLFDLSMPVVSLPLQPKSDRDRFHFGLIKCPCIPAAKPETEPSESVRISAFKRLIAPRNRWRETIKP